MSGDKKEKKATPVDVVWQGSGKFCNPTTKKPVDKNTKFTVSSDVYEAWKDNGLKLFDKYEEEKAASKKDKIKKEPIKEDVKANDLQGRDLQG